MPEYVVFNEVVVSKRSYMRGVTAIDPTALPALTAGACVRLSVCVRMWIRVFPCAFFLLVLHSLRLTAVPSGAAAGYATSLL